MWKKMGKEVQSRQVYMWLSIIPADCPVRETSKNPWERWLATLACPNK